MRLFWILLTVLVFGAMLLFDTAALLQLTWYCVSGHCGVRPLWIGVTAFAVVSVLYVLARLGRRSGAGGKTGGKRGARKAATPRKSAPRKQGGKRKA